MQYAFETSSEQETRQVAAGLARACKPSDCLLLIGDLGAGKTTFARGFIEALCDDVGEIVSPTFSLVQTYPTRNGATIWHFDLYRLKKPDDVQEIGLDEALINGISLIEWPQLITARLPANALIIELVYGPNEYRLIQMKGDASWADKLDNVQKTMKAAS